MSAARSPFQDITTRVRRAADVVRCIVGVPDYDRYVAHMRAHHPTETPLSRESFTHERLADKYSKPGARCC